MIISLGSSKGGVAKSTTACMLSTLLARAGADAMLLDADPQGTSSSFVGRRNAVEPALPVVHCAQKTGNIAATVRDLSKRYDVVLVDTGGRDSQELRTALLVSDVLITPVQASYADLETMLHIQQVVAQAKEINPELRCYALITRATTNPSLRAETEGAREFVGDLGDFMLLPYVIHERSVQRTAMLAGCGLGELPQNSATRAARAEIEMLGQYLFPHLAANVALAPESTQLEATI